MSLRYRPSCHARLDACQVLISARAWCKVNAMTAHPDSVEAPPQPRGPATRRDRPGGPRVAGGEAVRRPVGQHDQRPRRRGPIGLLLLLRLQVRRARAHHRRGRDTNSTSSPTTSPRASPEETPAAFAKRMVGSAAVVYAHNDPVMSACNAARNTDAEIREILDDFNEAVDRQDRAASSRPRSATGTADPISDDIHGAGAHAGGDDRVDAVRRRGVRRARTATWTRAVEILERLWLQRPVGRRGRRRAR